MSIFRAISRRLFLTGLLGALPAKGAFSAPGGIDIHSYPRLVLGPMVGAVTPTGARIWCRANGRYDVGVYIDSDRKFKNPTLASRLTAEPENGFVTVHDIRSLDRNQIYYYRILVNQGRHLGPWARFVPDLAFLPPFEFKNAPPEGSRADFRIAFGSCARVQADPLQRVWDAVAMWEPDLFFWLGDNMYGDSTSPVILEDQYQRQRAVPSMQKILRSIPQLAIWDDHDYGFNDSDRTNPVKEASLALFKRYWANPAYGLSESPGVFFSYKYGDVEFFFLDDRYYRDPNTLADNAEKTMLGAVQKAWLKEQLLRSKAPFKLLISGVGWTTIGGPVSDSWSSFLTERNEILSYIKDKNITGVVLLSGDTHVGELNAIPWSDHGGYDFYDLVSSPLAQNTGKVLTNPGSEVRIRQPYTGSVNVGVIDFFMSAEVPFLEFRLVNAQGGAVWQPLTLRADELVNGKTSWHSKSGGH